MTETLQEKVKILTPKFIKDERGWFLKVLTGFEENLSPQVGELYTTMAVSGYGRGGHYHEIAHEWFTVIAGKALLKLEDIDTGARMDVEMDAENPVTVFIPTRVAHIAYNAYEKDFIMVAYTDQKYNPKDTVPYQIN